MIYSNIIFQIVINNEKYLCFINYNEYNYYYLLSQPGNENLTKNDVTKKIINNYITHIDINNQFENYSINLIHKYFNGDIIENNVVYDIIINNETKYIKFIDTEYDYNTIYDKIKDNLWNGTIYEEDELEYLLVYEDVCDDMYYDSDDSDNNNNKKNINNDYDIEDNVYDISNIENFDEYDDYDKKEIIKIIEININRKNELEEMNNKTCFQNNFIKTKLEDTNNKIKIIQHFIDNIDDINIKNELLLKLGTLLCRKFKYKDINNLKNIKYNFIVTSAEIIKEYDAQKTNIEICSYNTPNIKGEFRIILFIDSNQHIYDTEKSYEIDNVTQKYSSQLFNFIFNEIQYYL